MGGGGGEGQKVPTYVHKFLKEPPTVAVSFSRFWGARCELMRGGRSLDVHSGVFSLILEIGVS
jgi:hypothetical protein